MSSLETEIVFRRKPADDATLPTQFDCCTEFTLSTDHQTSQQQQHQQQQLENDTETNTCNTRMKKIFSKKTLYRRLPILQWLPHYTRSDAIGDLIAGFTVGLTVIPQGLAYSSVAGLPTEYGLYGSFMGCFAYVLFGTCKDSTIGSTAIASLMVYQAAKGVWQRAVLLTFLTGIIEILMAVFQLGFIVDFVSRPVSAGFTSAVSLIICTSQIKSILGISSEGTTFLQRWISMIKDFDNVHIPDAILGVCCILILLTLRYIGRIKIGPEKDDQRTLYQRCVNKALWFFGVTRNASIVVVFIAISMYLEGQGKHYFRITGYIPAGLADVGLPPFSIEGVPGNATAGIKEVKGETFLEMVNNLGYSLIIVPMVALLENMSVCKAFAKTKPMDATQELIAVGVANVWNSLFKGYRANGGLARSAVNNASGVCTPLSNFYIGLVVVFALLYLTEYFYYIPKAILGGMIVSAVIFQVQYQVIRPMWRSKRTDLIPGFIAFIACLVMPLEIGILFAIGTDMLFILYHSSKPKVTMETLETSTGQKFLRITPDRCLIFPSVEFVRSLVLKSGHKSPLPVVIDCTYIYSADYTAAKVISIMVEDFRSRKQKIIFYNLKPSVAHIFEGLHTQMVLCYNFDSLMKELKDEDLNEIECKATDAVTPDGASNASTITLTKL